MTIRSYQEYQKEKSDNLKNDKSFIHNIFDDVDNLRRKHKFNKKIHDYQRLSNLDYLSPKLSRLSRLSILLTGHSLKH